VDVLTKLGEVFFKETNGLEEAESYLKKALSLDENHADALVTLGKVYEKKGNTDLAIAQYEKAIKEPVGNINAFYYLGCIYEK